MLSGELLHADSTIDISAQIEEEKRDAAFRWVNAVQEDYITNVLAVSPENAARWQGPMYRDIRAHEAGDGNATMQVWNWHMPRLAHDSGVGEKDVFLEELSWAVQSNRPHATLLGDMEQEASRSEDPRTMRHAQFLALWIHRSLSAPANRAGQVSNHAAEPVNSDGRPFDRIV